MERGERSGAENAGKMWEKLRRVEKRGRGGHSTPAASFWRTNEVHDSRSSSFISSRKLAAALWDLHYYKLQPLDNMRRRRLNPLHPPPATSSRLPENSSNLRRRAADLLTQHHRSIEKSSSRATSTASPSSSTEFNRKIAPCNRAASSSSTELRGSNGEQTNSLTTSTELLKVLNRVWSLEEKHVSNASLIKALKKELDRARFQAKEMAREQQGGRHEIDELMKHIAGDKHLRKSAAVQSMRGELDNERKLRNHSESSLRNLARELYEVKTSLASISKELGVERMSRGLVEDLCDELAVGLIDCEKELHHLRQKSGEDLSGRGDHDQLLILRISQAWLDERMQVKQEHWHDVAENNQTIDKLSSDIEAFLQIGRNGKIKIHGNQMHRNPMFQKSSLESIPLNVGASAPRDDDDDDDEDDGSSSSHSYCFEEDKITSDCGLKPQEQKQKELRELHKSSDSIRALSPLRLQKKFEEHMVRAMPYGVSRNQVENVEQITNEDHELASSFWRSFQSPVREWTKKLPPQDLNISEAPLKFFPELKESTLREKAVEARTRGPKSRSCQKPLIYPSRDE